MRKSSTNLGRRQGTNPPDLYPELTFSKASELIDVAEPLALEREVDARREVEVFELGALIRGRVVASAESVSELLCAHVAVDGVVRPGRLLEGDSEGAKCSTDVRRGASSDVFDFVEGDAVFFERRAEVDIRVETLGVDELVHSELLSVVMGAEPIGP